jgi:hypothetical protein
MRFRGIAANSSRKFSEDKMRNCFVIQPFDRGAFDKRFEDVFEPAIKGAELIAYRVDRDPGVSIPIDEIENGGLRWLLENQEKLLLQAEPRKEPDLPF